VSNAEILEGRSIRVWRDESSSEEVLGRTSRHWVVPLSKL